MNQQRGSNRMRWVFIGGGLLFLAVILFPRPSAGMDLEAPAVLLHDDPNTIATGDDAPLSQQLQQADAGFFPGAEGLPNATNRMHPRQGAYLPF